MKDFYQLIEPKIRPVVRLLRDKGWNTTCSCGHEMWVDVDLGKTGDAEDLATLLFDSGYKRFYIDVAFFVPTDGFWIRRAHVTIGRWPGERQLCPLPKQGVKP